MLKNRTANSSNGKIESSSESAGYGHVPAPFKVRYRRALKDLQQKRNLSNFQRSWRVSRDTAFADYRSGGQAGETFGSMPAATASAGGNLPAETVSAAAALEPASPEKAALESREFKA